MDRIRVKGQRKDHQVLLYAISTCGWCKKTKKLLIDHGVEYEYVDVDLASKEDQEIIHKDIQSRGGHLSFPTLIIDNKILITGYRPPDIKEALGL